MRKYNPWTITAVSLIFVGVATAAAGLEEVTTLLTKEEVESLAEQPPMGLVDVAVGFDDGPAIELVTPTTGEGVQSPFLLHIRFTPQNGRDVELGRLKVELIKALSFDITRRIMPFVSKGGIRIERVALPQGEFKFRVSLGDVGGGVSMKMFSVKVL